MLIERIEIFHVAMPLIYPWRTAYGEDASIESLLIKVSSEDQYGWGEATPFAAPCYSPEWAAGIFAMVNQWLAPALINQEIPSGEVLNQTMGMFKGNHFAKGAMDTAWWSLHSKLQEKPLYQALGGTRNRVPVGADFGVMDSLDELVEAVGRAVDDGFPRVKLKFRPGWDLDMLEAVRSTFPELTIHIDCNSGYRLQDSAMFQKIDRFHLAMIEQPLQHDDVVDHAKLAQKIETPICLDESINSIDRARQAIEMKSCRWINVKPGRVGGLTQAVAIHDLCQDAGIPCWVGGMLESAVGASFCVALATLNNFTYPPDIFPSSRFYHRDLADPPLVLDTSSDIPHVVVSDDFRKVPEPLPEELEKCCVQRAVFE